MSITFDGPPAEQDDGTCCVVGCNLPRCSKIDAVCYPHMVQSCETEIREQRLKVRELTAENARLRRQVERLASLVEEAACGTLAQIWDLFAGEIYESQGMSVNDMARDTYEKGKIKKQLDAILADEPGEAENGN